MSLGGLGAGGLVLVGKGTVGAGRGIRQCSPWPPQPQGVHPQARCGTGPCARPWPASSVPRQPPSEDLFYETYYSLSQQYPLLLLLLLIVLLGLLGCSCGLGKWQGEQGGAKGALVQGVLEGCGTGTAPGHFQVGIRGSSFQCVFFAGTWETSARPC